MAFRNINSFNFDKLRNATASNFNFDSWGKKLDIDFDTFPKETVMQQFPSNVYLTHISDDGYQLAASFQNTNNIIWYRNSDIDFWKILYAIPDQYKPSTDEQYREYQIRNLTSYNQGQYIFFTFLYRDIDNIVKYMVYYSDNFERFFQSIAFQDQTTNYNTVKFRILNDRYFVKAEIYNFNFTVYIRFDYYDIINGSQVMKNIVKPFFSNSNDENTAPFRRMLFFGESINLNNFILEGFDIDENLDTVVISIKYLNTTSDQYTVDPGKYLGWTLCNFNFNNAEYFLDTTTYEDPLKLVSCINFITSEVGYIDYDSYSLTLANMYKSNLFLFQDNFMVKLVPNNKTAIYYNITMVEILGGKTIIVPYFRNSINDVPFVLSSRAQEMSVSSCAFYQGMGSISIIGNSIIFSSLSDDGIDSCAALNTSDFDGTLAANYNIYTYYKGICNVNNYGKYLYHTYDGNMSYGEDMTSPLVDLVSKTTISIDDINSLITTPEYEMYFYNDGTIQILNSNYKFLVSTDPVDTSSYSSKKITKLSTWPDGKIFVFNNNQSYILTSNSNNNLSVMINLMNTYEYNEWCRKNCTSGTNENCLNLENCLIKYNNYCTALQKYSNSSSYPGYYNDTDQRCICTDTEGILNYNFPNIDDNKKAILLPYAACLSLDCSKLRTDIYHAAQSSFPIAYTKNGCNFDSINICDSNIQTKDNSQIVSDTVEVIQNCGKSIPTDAPVTTQNLVTTVTPVIIDAPANKNFFQTPVGISLIVLLSILFLAGFGVLILKLTKKNK